MAATETNAVSGPNTFDRLVSTLRGLARAIWRISVVAVTPLLGIAGGLWIASSFAPWFGNHVDSEFAKIAGLSGTAATLILKSLKSTLTYLKEGLQYIQRKIEVFDADKYAIDVLITCLGIAIFANIGTDEAPAARIRVASPPSVPTPSIDPVLFFPTFHFASAIPVEVGGVQIAPGLEVQRDSVEPGGEHMKKLQEFVTRLLTCAQRDDARPMLVIGFASDSKFFDAGKVRADSDRLNLTVANLRAANTARELNNAVAAIPNAPSITFVESLWPIANDSDVEASVQAMREKRAVYSERLKFAFNSSMDDRAAVVVMNTGTVCSAQAYQPHYRAVTAGH
jgi:hypothetical protein